MCARVQATGSKDWQRVNAYSHKTEHPALIVFSKTLTKLLALYLQEIAQVLNQERIQEIRELLSKDTQSYVIYSKDAPGYRKACTNHILHQNSTIPWIYRKLKRQRTRRHSLET